MARKSVVKRETQETSVGLELDLDGSGKWEITTGIRMFDHLLSQLAQHGKFDIKCAANGADAHHVVEDVAICLGKAFREALGERRGIVRMGNALVPMDDALVMVAVDLSGRAYTVLDLPFSDNDMTGFPSDLVRHFLESFAAEARMNLHALVHYGANDHHKAEAIFKGLGRALDMAARLDLRLGNDLPTTKNYWRSKHDAAKRAGSRFTRVHTGFMYRNPSLRDTTSGDSHAPLEEREKRSSEWVSGVWSLNDSGYLIFIPVSRSYAVQYNLQVLSKTSFGSDGAGGSLFHPDLASQSRTGCLS